MWLKHLTSDSIISFKKGKIGCSHQVASCPSPLLQSFRMQHQALVVAHRSNTDFAPRQVDFMSSLGYEAYLLSSLGGLRVDGVHWDSDDLEFCRDPALGFARYFTEERYRGKELPCWADVAFVRADRYVVVDLVASGPEH
jgi:hypothetical protein